MAVNKNREISKLPWCTDGCASVAFLRILCGWMQKVAYRFQAATVELNMSIHLPVLNSSGLFSIKEMKLWRLYMLITSSSLSDAEVEHCECFCIYHREQVTAVWWIRSHIHHIILSPTLCFIVWTYSVSLWFTAIPSSDAKNANLYFLDVVQQANSIFHLFDKQFNDQLMPLIRSVLGK